MNFLVKLSFLSTATLGYRWLSPAEIFNCYIKIDLKQIICQKKATNLSRDRVSISRGIQRKTELNIEVKLVA